MGWTYSSSHDSNSHGSQLSSGSANTPMLWPCSGHAVSDPTPRRHNKFTASEQHTSLNPNHTRFPTYIKQCLTICCSAHWRHRISSFIGLAFQSFWIVSLGKISWSVFPQTGLLLQSKKWRPRTKKSMHIQASRYTFFWSRKNCFSSIIWNN